ncbi:MAG: heavy metal-binding domain-containing protein [Pseudohongiellaceae bacterium]
MTPDAVMAIKGARKGRPSMLRKLVSRALARNLSCLIVPGPEVALAHGLDVTAAGMRITATPRDAGVLLIVGHLSGKMDEAVAVLYAQMPRPRALLVLGGQTPSSLPHADTSAGLSQAELIDAVSHLRQSLTEGSFAISPEDFDAPVLHTSTEHVCPMHPEVIQDEPGSCPKCGMDLVAREAGNDAGTGETASEQGPDHEHGENEHHHDHGHDHQHARAGYTCPMHPEVVQDEPGSCPECGMDLVAKEDVEDEGQGEKSSEHGHCHEHQQHGGSNGHSAHEQASHDHGATGFMSMIEVTKDLPRSADGLAMDWLEVPFGPVFPGLPGGLKLMLTLDGDGVTEGQATSLVGITTSEESEEMGVETFVERLSRAIPLAPISYRLLACLAIERAAGQENDPATARTRAAALERERIASHLGWLAQLGRQLGFDWLTRRATALQLAARGASQDHLVALRPSLQALTAGLGRTPLLKARLQGGGVLSADSPGLRGPVARAAGSGVDTRESDAVYRELGFEICTGEAGDAWARLWQRLDEITASLDLIETAGEPGLPVLRDIGSVSGTGEASVETPRGRAQLNLTLNRGQVASYDLDTACSHHIGLVAKLVAGRELGDALVAVGSLDLSPWEVSP